MKKTFLATGFIFVVCVVVFLFINAQPVSQDSRFQGVLFDTDEELENGVVITFSGETSKNIFTSTKYTGTVTIASGRFSEVFTDVSFTFQGKSAECVLTDNDGEEFGTLMVSDDFESIYVKVTDSQYTNGSESISIAAPATSLEQAQEITENF